MKKLAQIKIFDTKKKLDFSLGVRLGEKSPDEKFISERDHDVFLLKEMFRSVLRHLYDDSYRLDIIESKHDTNNLFGFGVRAATPPVTDLDKS